MLGELAVVRPRKRRWGVSEEGWEWRRRRVG
jgi:hypothetical protein